MKRFEIAEKDPYRDFDLPVVHLPEYVEGHYAPTEPLMDGDEARSEGSATVTWRPQVATEQFIGTRIASNTLRLVEAPESIAFTGRLLAASGLNTAWYSFARLSENVQRRRLKLPQLDNPNPDWRPTSRELHQNAIDDLDFAQWPAYKIVSAYEYSKVNLLDFNPEFGRAIGSVALKIAAIDVGDKVHSNARVSDFLTQHLVRERAKDTLRDSAMLIKQLKSFPSVAQLANPNSDLATFMRHNGPLESREAFNVALEEGVTHGTNKPDFVKTAS